MTDGPSLTEGLTKSHVGIGGVSVGAAVAVLGLWSQMNGIIDERVRSQITPVMASIEAKEQKFQIISEGYQKQIDELKSTRIQRETKIDATLAQILERVNGVASDVAVLKARTQ